MTTGTLNSWSNLNVTGRVDVDELTVSGVPIPNNNAVTPASVTTSLLVVSTQTPASATAPGVKGTIAWDSNFIYVCTATNTWKQVAIATWA
jgi:hypothetical protein